MKIYVNGKETEISRSNYILRSAIIPAGKHEIVMKFVPDALKTDKWCMAAMIIAVLLSLAGLWLHFSGKEQVCCLSKSDPA